MARTRQSWHFSRQKVVYAICRFKPVFTGKKWQKLAKTQKSFSTFVAVSIPDV